MHVSSTDGDIEANVTDYDVVNVSVAYFSGCMRRLSINTNVYRQQTYLLLDAINTCSLFHGDTRVPGRGWWRCWQAERCFLPTVPRRRAVFDVISVLISRWCVRSMAPLDGSFISLFPHHRLDQTYLPDRRFTVSTRCCNVYGVVAVLSQIWCIFFILSTVPGS